MASEKEVGLLLAARFDAGDSLASAATLAQGIAATLEKAFEGVGERIADKMLRELQGKINGGAASGGILSGGTAYHGEKRGINEFSLTTDNKLISPHSTQSLVAPASSFNPTGYSYGSGSGHGSGMSRGGDVRSLYAGSLTQLAMNNSALQRQMSATYGIAGEGSLAEDNILRLSQGKNRLTLEDKNSKAHREALYNANIDGAVNADSVLAKAKVIGFAQDMGSNLGLGSFLSKDQLKSATSAASTLGTESVKAFVELANVMTELKKELSQNTKEISESKSATERAALQEKGLGIRQKMDDNQSDSQKAFDTAEKASAEKKTLDQMTREISYGKNGRFPSAMAALGAVGAVTSYIGDYDTVRARGQAGTQDLASFGGRDVSSLDYDRMIATDLMGGEDELKKRAKRNVQFQVAGGWASGVGQVGVGVGMGLLGGPIGIAAGLGLATNGMGVLKKTHSDVAMFDKHQAEEMRKLQGIEIEKQQDLLGLSNRGRSITQNSYLDARAMGDERMDRFLLGDFSEGGMANFAVKGAQLSTSDYTSGLRTYANQVGPIAFGRDFTQIGGKLGQTAETPFNKMYQDSLVLEGKGFGNAVGSAGTFYSGMATKATNAEGVNAEATAGGNMSNNLFNTLIGSGIDRKMAVSMMDNTLTPMAGSGYGMAEIATDMGNRVAGAAQSNPQMRTQAGMGLLMEAEQHKRSRADGGNGVGSMVKLQNIDALERKLGVKFSKADKILMQNGSMDAAGLETVVKRSEGYDKNNDYKYDEEAKGFRDNVRSGINKVNDSMTTEKGVVNALETGNQGTLSANIAYHESLGKDVKPTVNQSLVDDLGSLGEHSSKGKDLNQLENKVGLEQTIAGFTAMNRLLPDLNLKFDAFVGWLGALKEKMDDMDLPNKSKNGSQMIDQRPMNAPTFNDILNNFGPQGTQQAKPPYKSGGAP